MTIDTIERAIGRNETSIEAGSSGLVFVKRVIGPDTDAERRYRNCLWFDEAQRTSLPTPISPPVVESDDATRRLAYPYLTDAHSLQDELSDWACDDWSIDHSFVGEVVRAAELLGTVHTMPVGVARCGRPRVAGTSHDGPIRRFEWLTVDEYAAASGGELGCWRLFHHDRELRDAVSAWCRAQTEIETITAVHGDVRPDQFVIDVDDMVILDWEEFGVGSPVRDTAGVVGAIIFEVLRETFASAEASTSDPLAVHESFLERGERNLRAVGPVVAAFIARYRDVTAGAVTLGRLADDVGFYLLERVIGRSMIQSSMRPVDRAIAGVARSILLEPAVLSRLIHEEM